jgi:hypothetical protein
MLKRQQQQKKHSETYNIHPVISRWSRESGFSCCGCLFVNDEMVLGNCRIVLGNRRPTFVILSLTAKARPKTLSLRDYSFCGSFTDGHDCYLFLRFIENESNKMQRNDVNDFFYLLETKGVFENDKRLPKVENLMRHSRFSKSSSTPNQVIRWIEMPPSISSYTVIVLLFRHF